MRFRSGGCRVWNAGVGVAMGAPPNEAKAADAPILPGEAIEPDLDALLGGGLT
ncbi:MAG: hypothetical protein ACUVQI_07760 [Thermochromatium sp.]